MTTFDITTNPAKPTAIHDPQALLDYAWDFTNLMDAGDLITSAVFIPCLSNPGGPVLAGVSITLGAVSADGKKVWGWLSITDLGLVNSTVAITCHHTSAAGRSDDRTLYFKIRNR